MMVGVPMDHVKDLGFILKAVGKPLPNSENDIRFAVLKHHFWTQNGRQIRAVVCSILRNRERESQGLFSIIQIRTDTKGKNIDYGGLTVYLC